MRLGFFTMPVHPLSKKVSTGLSEDRGAILLADPGLSEAYSGEHSTDIAESITSTNVLFASVARDARQLPLGDGTVNLPNNRPVRDSRSQ